MKKTLILLMIVFMTGCFNNKKDKDFTDEEKKESYQEIENKMREYYESHYNDIKEDLTGELADAIIKIRLIALYEVYNYDISDFIDPETQEQCSIEESFGYIIQDPDKELYPDEDYVIEVYFKCGDYVNREFPEEKKE
jgi:hypothetical protein